MWGIWGIAWLPSPSLAMTGKGSNTKGDRQRKGGTVLRVAGILAAKGFNLLALLAGSKPRHLPYPPCMAQMCLRRWWD